MFDEFENDDIEDDYDYCDFCGSPVCDVCGELTCFGCSCDNEDDEDKMIVS